MDKINIDKILEREELAKEIKKTLVNFENNKKDLTQKRGIYIYGSARLWKDYICK